MPQTLRLAASRQARPGMRALRMRFARSVADESLFGFVASGVLVGMAAKPTHETDRPDDAHHPQNPKGLPPAKRDRESADDQWRDGALRPAHIQMLP